MIYNDLTWASGGRVTRSLAHAHQMGFSNSRYCPDMEPKSLHNQFSFQMRLYCRFDMRDILVMNTLNEGETC